MLVSWQKMSKITANNSSDISRLLWQGRRGALELDIILTRYITNRYTQLTEDLQQDFQLLLAEDDPKLMDWLVYKIPASPQRQKIVADVLANSSD